MGPLRTEILKRPSFRSFYSRVVIDWEYLEARSEESLVREARWWRWQKLAVVVDFTSGNQYNLPWAPLRLCNDWWYSAKNDTNGTAAPGPWYKRSMARLTAVLNKMPIAGAADALLTLHRPGGGGGTRVLHLRCRQPSSSAFSGTPSLRLRRWQRRLT
jgi:hypothetical protein